MLIYMTMCTRVGYMDIYGYVSVWICIFEYGLWESTQIGNSMQAFEKLWGGNTVKCVCV